MVSIVSASNQPIQPTIIRLTDQELATKAIGSHNLEAALEALHVDGLVVLENAVDPAHLDKLNARMVVDAWKLYGLETTHVNFGPQTGNIQQEPAAEEGYVFDDVVANPWAAAILECMMGPNPRVRLYSANTAFKATARQPVHIDLDCDFRRLPMGFCVNINLVSTSPRNGATEVWLGTHNDVRCNMLANNGSNNKHIADALVEERRRVRPPIQPSLPKGSLIIRDIRLWHAGMPNLTDPPRIMLVSVLFPYWYRSKQKFRLPKRWQGKIQWGKLDPCVEWVENDDEYLRGSHDIDFAQLP